MDPASATVAAVSIVLSGMALVISIQQWSLAQDQTTLTKKQAEIAEEQQKFVRDQLAKRSVLATYARIATLRPTDFEVNVVLKNIGDKAADSYYYELFIPENWYKLIHADLTGREQRRELVHISGAIFTKLHGFQDAPLFPTRYVTIATLVIPLDIGRPHPYFQMHWLVTANDGQFPGEGVYGKIAMPPNRGDHPPTSALLDASEG